MKDHLHIGLGETFPKLKWILSNYSFNMNELIQEKLIKPDLFVIDGSMRSPPIYL